MRNLVVLADEGLRIPATGCFFEALSSQLAIRCGCFICRIERQCGEPRRLVEVRCSAGGPLRLRTRSAPARQHPLAELEKHPQRFGAQLIPVMMMAVRGSRIA